ncbi:DUF2793 domain-containing protein [Leisingera daeponensis]|uniref:DUF2793 domain-containing protein n=1 Tax=Leisingera daeponensis TaxID=405746 RepID=UPI0021BD6176|nr:DUF2793 domain-containing protein [Leisingera daeponensis]
MTQASPILALPYLMPPRAQKHVIHNAALQMLDALVQLTIQGFDAATLLSHAGSDQQICQR